MSKTMMPFCVGDISTFAKSLRKNLETLDRAPGHVEMLNLLARSGGYRNFQHFRAQHQASQALQSPRPEPAQVNYKAVKETARCFNHAGLLERWPKKFTHRMLCLWVMWSRLPARQALAEREISDRLQAWHLFGDYALLRRELVDRGMVTRTPDGREYRRLEQSPPPEAVALLEYLRK